MISHADLNAVIPTFILAKVAEKQPMNLYRLRKLAVALSPSASKEYAVTGMAGAAAHSAAVVDAAFTADVGGSGSRDVASTPVPSMVQPAASGGGTQKNEAAAALKNLVSGGGVQSAGVTKQMKSSSLLMDPCK
jgi:hypothetical protein